MSYLSTLSSAYAEIFLLVMASSILIVDLFVTNPQQNADLHIGATDSSRLRTDYRDDP